MDEEVTHLRPSALRGGRFRPLHPGTPLAIYSLGEDEAGGLWVGTGYGAYRYDDGTFAPTPPDSLAGRVVTSVEEDAAGRLWFGTDAGFTVFDGTSYESFFTDRQNLQADYVTDTEIDRHGRLWVATYGRGVRLVRRRDRPHLVRGVGLRGHPA